MRNNPARVDLSLAFPFGLLVAAASFCFLAQPSLHFRLHEESLYPGSPLVVGYSQPLRAEGIETKVKVLDEVGNGVPGAVAVRTRSLVFTPERNLEPGKSYELLIEGVTGRYGSTVAEPYRTRFRMPFPSWLFINEAQQLALIDSYDRLQVLTSADISIQQYSVGLEQKWIAIYSPRDNQYTNGILLGNPTGDGYNVTALPLTEVARYSHVWLCDHSRVALALAPSGGADATIYAWRVDWGAASGPALERIWELQSETVASGDDIACSQESPRVVYRGTDGGFVSGFIGESTSYRAGNFDQVYGIGARDEGILFQKQRQNREGGTDLELVWLSQEGESHTIAQTDAMAWHWSVSTDGQRGVVIWHDFIANEDHYRFLNMQPVLTTATDRSIGAGERINVADISPDGYRAMLEISDRTDITRAGVRFRLVGQEGTIQEYPWPGTSPRFLRE